jgi:hypothetical protein
MSNLFKNVQTHSKNFNDSFLLGMSSYWNNNGKLTIQEIRKKWDQQVANSNATPIEFIQGLKQALRTSKERLKKIYKIESSSFEAFEQSFFETIQALERAYLSN